MCSVGGEDAHRGAGRSAGQRGQRRRSFWHGRDLVDDDLRHRQDHSTDAERAAGSRVRQRERSKWGHRAVASGEPEPHAAREPRRLTARRRHECSAKLTEGVEPDGRRSGDAHVCLVSPRTVEARREPEWPGAGRLLLALVAYRAGRASCGLRARSSPRAASSGAVLGCASRCAAGRSGPRRT